MKRYLLSTLTALLLPLLATAQEIIVRSFEDITLQNAVQTTGDWPETNEGEPASKIIVQVQYKDQLTFAGRVLTDEKTQQPMVQHLGSEYTVFMAPRSQSITIKLPGFNDKRIDVRQYLKDGLQPRGLYLLRLSVIPKSVMTGRNVSMGISGGYLMPMIAHSATGYNGGPVNYGNGTAAEDASYKGAQGYVAGVHFDIRLRKNLYLNTGINFGQYRYKNEFNGPTAISTGYVLSSGQKYPMYAYYKESYVHSYLEVPIYVSYRFPTGRRSNLQIGVGPAINYGLTANMKFNGTLTSIIGGWLNDVGDWRNTMYSGEFDLYSKHIDYDETISYFEGINNTCNTPVDFDKSPLNRFGLMAGAYIAYELHGVQLSIHYQYQLTNKANSGYWDNRLAPQHTHDNMMTDAKLRHNFLQFKLGYTFRY